ALAVLGAILVDRARGDLLGRLLALAAFEKAVLDVLVLAFALGAPSCLGHRVLPETVDRPAGNPDAGEWPRLTRRRSWQESVSGGAMAPAASLPHDIRRPQRQSLRRPARRISGRPPRGRHRDGRQRPGLHLA